MEKSHFSMVIFFKRLKTYRNAFEKVTPYVFKTILKLVLKWTLELSFVVIYLSKECPCKSRIYTHYHFEA